MVEYHCLECSSLLKEVKRPVDSPLNPEQWASQRAGDYYCETCPGERGKSGHRYYWKSELEARVDTR
ncbi:MAG: hypothetical protein WCV90_08125 [Candidatus Woesearchaeota archaeon]|jgi:hypothetical protein